MLITVVGHADLAPGSMGRIERRLAQTLRQLPADAVGLLRAGSGATLAFGRALHATGRTFVAVLPARDGLPAALPAQDAEAARELLRLAASARMMPFDAVDRDARIGLEEELVAESSQVLAVWDGSPSDGRDATAHLIAYARGRGVPVTVVWPSGSERTSARGGRQPWNPTGPTNLRNLTGVSGPNGPMPS